MCVWYMTIDELIQYVLGVSRWDYILLGVLLFLVVCELYYYLRYMHAVPRYVRNQSRREDEVPVAHPGVSVVVCARNEAHNLEAYLQSLLNQDYPAYEVIVVNDGSQDDTQTILDRYEQEDARLRCTFVPANARMRSTKKLALTLAAKAAAYDYLLLTDADCRPESTHWISEMMAGFRDDHTQIVLGYGAYFADHSRVNRLVRFDTLYNGLLYLGAALCGHPYMGVGRNLAYRKDLFFSIGGFSSMAHQMAGDDDLFVNKVATARNTAVVVSRESVTWSVSKQNWSDWVMQKRRHLSVSPDYRFLTKFRLVLEPMCRALMYADLILLGVFAAPVSWLVGLVLFLVRLFVAKGVINSGAEHFGEPAFGFWRILWYDISLPLLTLYLMTTKPFYKQGNW